MAKQTIKFSVSFRFFYLLTLVFIGLKLSGSVSWSWWFVLAPVAVPVGFHLFWICLIGIAVLATCEATDKGRKPW